MKKKETKLSYEKLKEKEDQCSGGSSCSATRRLPPSREIFCHFSSAEMRKRGAALP